MTSSITVYKKHYPPALTDEVWRLERIGKDGAFHNRLSAENINTVQDFLKLWAVNPVQLRKVKSPKPLILHNKMNPSSCYIARSNLLLMN